MTVVEQIQWRSVAIEKPDAETTVLVHSPELDEPVWLGFLDEGEWHDVSGAPIGGVTHWSHLPTGPVP